MKHLATKQRRKEQMQQYYDALEKTPKGRLTKVSKEKWDGWLHAENISSNRAKQIMSGYDEKRIESKKINQETADKYIIYLQRFGYKVVAPK